MYIKNKKNIAVANIVWRGTAWKCGTSTVFGFVMDTRPMAQLCENQFFHNSISCNNIQGTDSSLGKRQRKGERMAAFSFSACVVAVATLDGCVCQGERPCSLMMAMPSHKPSPADVCVWVCVRVIFQDGWSVCVALTANQSTSQCSSPVRRQNTHSYNHTYMHFWTFKNNGKHTKPSYHLIIKKLLQNFTMDAMETRAFRPSVLKGFPAIAMATDWLMGGTFSRSSSGPPVLFFPPRVSETTETNGDQICRRREDWSTQDLNYSHYCAKLLKLPSLY